MNGPHFKHGKLAEFVTCKWNHALPHLLPIAALGSIRTVAARHGIQFRTRASTEAGKRWLFLRPNKKAGEVSSTGQTPHPSTRQGAIL